MCVLQYLFIYAHIIDFPGMVQAWMKFYEHKVYRINMNMGSLQHLCWVNREDFSWVLSATQPQTWASSFSERFFFSHTLDAEDLSSLQSIFTIQNLCFHVSKATVFSMEGHPKHGETDLSVNWYTEGKEHIFGVYPKDIQKISRKMWLPVIVIVYRDKGTKHFFLKYPSDMSILGWVSPLWPSDKDLTLFVSGVNFPSEAWASADVSGVRWTSFSSLASLSGCRLYSSACQIQPRPVGRLPVHGWWTEVSHVIITVWIQIPAGSAITERHHVVSVRNENKPVFN